jgi:predicted MPP superfamily phosphohydrolase
MDCYKAINTNAAYVIGNHDDGCLFYSDTIYNDHKSNQQVMYPNEQFNRYTKYGLHNRGTSNYWFSDVGDVRIICLYQRDFDYSVSIPGIEAFKISTDQLNWLTVTALDTTLPVIILTHAPLVASLYNKSREGFDAVLSALTAFKNGGGIVIAVLSGHTHTQASAKVDGINHIVFKNGYGFFELVSVDLSAKTITCKAIANSTLEDMSFTY